MEYINNADKLAADVFRFAVRLPKRYTWKIGNPLFNHAEMVSFHCRSANIVYVKDQATFDKRRSHLLDAEAELLHVEALLGICHTITLKNAESGDCKHPNENVYRNFAKLIENQRKLLSGCKRRDTQQYNTISEASGRELPV